MPLSLVPAEATGPGTVLYIEDQPSNVRLIERLLSTRPGLTLLHAADGGRGLAVARARRPDLILLDLHLPDQPGERVLRQIRADADLRATPVVVLSADATARQLSRLREAWASEYLTKPLDLGEVLALVDRMLAVREPQHRGRLHR